MQKKNSSYWARVAAYSAIIALAGGCAIDSSPLVMPSAEQEVETANDAALIEIQTSSGLTASNNSDLAASTLMPPAPPMYQAGPETPAATTDNSNSNTPGHHDIWHRIPAAYTIRHASNERIDTEVRSLLRHQNYLSRVSERAAPYLYHIVEEIELRGMPMELALLPIVESAYQPFAYSPSRAAGLWQFIPGTARRYGLKINWWYDGRRDVIAATDAALNYLQYLYDEFDDWLLAVAAYNAGEGTVHRAIKKARARGKATDFWSLPLPRETRHYVPRLLAVAAIIEKPDHFGVALHHIPNEPYLELVDTGSQIDLALVEKLADVSIETIYRLNPGLNQWATDPDGPHHIALPVERAEQFKEALAQQPDETRVKWQRHKIQTGENLGRIAEQYNTQVAVLQRVNNLQGSMIRAGHELLIPVAVKNPDSYVLSMDQRLSRVQRSGEGQKLIYKVRRGDSLWKIASDFDVNIAQLMRWNSLAKNEVIKPGRRLIIWRHQKATTASNHAPARQGRPATYVVRRGDSLHRISQRFGISINDLLAWNALDKSSHLQPGQTLKVSANAT